MDISLLKANENDTDTIYDMQIKSFMPLLQKYKDYNTSPANENVEIIVELINKPFIDYYIIKYQGINVGAIRIVKRKNKQYYLNQIFVLPEYQNKGIAQKAISIIEEIYDDASSWELDTILQETGNCYLYEKLGYKKTGKEEIINDKMTIVFYEKFPK